MGEYESFAPLRATESAMARVATLKEVDKFESLGTAELVLGVGGEEGAEPRASAFEESTEGWLT